MSLKWTVDTLAKVIAAAGGVGLGGFVQQAYSDSSAQRYPTEEEADAGQAHFTAWIWDFNWDKRDPAVRLLSRNSFHGKSQPRPSKEQFLAQLDQATPRAPRNIFLIRHGQYNLKGESDNERKLTELGRKQARATGNRLKFFLKESDRYVVSDMTRALETAEIIGTRLRLEPKSKPLEAFECDPLLREGGPIVPDPPNHYHPELSYHADGARIEAAFRKYFHRAEPEQEKESFEVIVCHANVIRYFCCRALQFPPERWLRISLAHSSITHIRIEPDGEVNLLSLGDCSHLPKDLLTTK